MKGLLDTHTFIWWDSDPGKISSAAMTFLRDAGNEVLLSVVSVWEILIKQHLGKLTLRLPLSQILTQQQANGIRILPITLSHVLAVEGLPTPHKDPFDRFHRPGSGGRAVLLTADAIFAHYPVRVLW
jgi:PIN domain nuclease of toxin-antitoxin system